MRDQTKKNTTKQGDCITLNRTTTTTTNHMISRRENTNKIKNGNRLQIQEQEQEQETIMIKIGNLVDFADQSSTLVRSGTSFCITNCGISVAFGTQSECIFGFQIAF